jgi:hypothetical protein
MILWSTSAPLISAASACSAPSSPSSPSFLAAYTVKQIGIKKGIDLQGGSEFVVELQPAPRRRRQRQARSCQRHSAGHRHPRKTPQPGRCQRSRARPQGEKRILIQMPGVTEEEVKQRPHPDRESRQARVPHRPPQQRGRKLAQMKANGTLSVDHVEDAIQRRPTSARQIPPRPRRQIRQRAPTPTSTPNAAGPSSSSSTKKAANFSPNSPKPTSTAASASWWTVKSSLPPT